MRRRASVKGLLAGLLAGAAVCLPGLAPRAAEPITHQSSAASSVTVGVMPDGTVDTVSRNARLLPYTLFNVTGEKPTVFPRLATITTELHQRSDAESPVSATVSVTIDDLSQAAPRRLAAFTDPGAEGKLIGERYFVSTSFGCCGGVDSHVVRATETGRLLFKSTGAGDLGRTAWAEMPNARPPLVRWAAFDGNLDEAALKQGMLGTLSYGGENGASSSLRLRIKATHDTVIEKNLELSSGVDLGWIDGKRSASKQGFQRGDVESPASMWIAEGAKSALAIGGFSLVLCLGKESLAVIPVEADRLQLDHARLAPGILLIDLSQPH
jgi:hypothetical protein